MYDLIYEDGGILNRERCSSLGELEAKFEELGLFYDVGRVEPWAKGASLGDVLEDPQVFILVRSGGERLI